MRDRALALAHDGIHDDEIAAILTREGHRSPTCKDRVLPVTVQLIRRADKLKVSQQRIRWWHGAGQLSAPELAAKLGIPVNWLYVQIRKKRLVVVQQPDGAYLFNDDAKVLNSPLTKSSLCLFKAEG